MIWLLADLTPGAPTRPLAGSVASSVQPTAALATDGSMTIAARPAASESIRRHVKRCIRGLLQKLRLSGLLNWAAAGTRQRSRAPTDGNRFMILLRGCCSFLLLPRQAKCHATRDGVQARRRE